MTFRNVSWCAIESLNLVQRLFLFPKDHASLRLPHDQPEVGTPIGFTDGPDLESSRFLQGA